MKDYKEMAKCVLEARDAYDAKKGKKRPDGSEVHKLQNPESNNRKDDNDNRNGKRKVWFYAPILSGLAAAAAIAFIVSDHSVDRQEEKTTEIVSEATEEEATEMPVTTEEVIQERATVSVRKEKDEQTPEVKQESEKNKQKQGSEGKNTVKVDSENPSDQGEGKKKDSEKQSDNNAKKDDQEPGVTDKTEQKENSRVEVIIPDTEAVTEEATTSNQDTSPEKDDPDNKTPKNNESQVNVDTSLASNWQQVLQGENGISYVIMGKPTRSDPRSPYSCKYCKCYKGFKTTDYSWFYFDGTICTDQISVDNISLEMLQSVDFSRAEKNQQEIEERMAEMGYVRSSVGPGMMTDPWESAEPLIQKNKDGSSLICAIAYQFSGQLDEATEEKCKEYFGASPYSPMGCCWDVTFDIISGDIISRH